MKEKYHVSATPKRRNPQDRPHRAIEYNFGALTVNGPALVETEVVDAAKVSSKLASALVAYRRRTGDKSKFSIRIFKQADNTDAVGCWKIADAPAADATAA